MPKPRYLFVITDGGRARFVERSPDSGHYATFEERDAGPRLQSLRKALRASPPGRAISSTSPRRAAVGPEDALRSAKEAFVAEAADHAAEVCRARGLTGVVVAAPPRLLGAFKARLEGQAPLAAAIRKDLAKTPDSQLGAWLNEVFLHPQVAS